MGIHGLWRDGPWHPHNPERMSSFERISSEFNVFPTSCWHSLGRIYSAGEVFACRTHPYWVTGKAKIFPTTVVYVAATLLHRRARVATIEIRLAIDPTTYKQLQLLYSVTSRMLLESSQKLRIPVIPHWNKEIITLRKRLSLHLKTPENIYGPILQILCP